MWNSTLRGDRIDTIDDTEAYGAGLVALSLKGNDITKDGLALLSRAIRKNNWILGG